MLDKRLKIGGLQVGGPRTQQNTARFRVADNVYQTIDEYMVPRFGCADSTVSFASSTEVVGATSYKDSPVYLGLSSGKYVPYNSTGALIPSGIMPDEIESVGPIYHEKLDCLYFMFPEFGLYKYDGIQMYRAGSPLPYCSGNANTSAPDCTLRFVQHTVDFQGNAVHSGYMQFPALSSGGSITVRTDKAATDILDGTTPVAFMTNVSPTIKRPYEERAQASLGYNSYFFSTASQVLNAGTSEVEVTTNGDHLVTPGCYVMSGVLQSLAIWSEKAYFTAWKVKRSDATKVYLDMNNVKIYGPSGEWLTVNYSGLGLGGLGDCANYWISMWSTSAATPTGTYVYKGLKPAMYESNVNHSYPITLGTVTTPADLYQLNPFNIAPILGDFYDETSSKAVFSFNSSKPRCFGVYDDRAFIGYDNEIEHSDSTLGGCFEMTEDLANIVVGETKNGPIQALCGNSDFLFVSRRKRNYYVAGNIPTANYRVQEISQTPIGAYSAECVAAVSDKVIFLNKLGIWALYAGGRCDEISENIRGLFDNSSNTTIFGEEAYFDLEPYSTFADTANFTDKWIRARWDIKRGLLIFIKKLDALVLNLNNGEFYTWSKMNAGTTAAAFKDLTFVDGNYYAAMDNKVFREDKTITPFVYSTTAPIKLKTTWFVAGEPSLEKKLNQLKLWGICQGNHTISHELDWKNGGTADGVYVNTDAQKFSHKQRLTSCNFQAVSVSIQVDPTHFELEGLEIEWQPLQGAMKK